MNAYFHGADGFVVPVMMPAGIRFIVDDSGQGAPQMSSVSQESTDISFRLPTETIFTDDDFDPSGTEMRSALEAAANGFHGADGSAFLLTMPAGIRFIVDDSGQGAPQMNSASQESTDISFSLPTGTIFTIEDFDAVGAEMRSPSEAAANGSSLPGHWNFSGRFKDRFCPLSPKVSTLMTLGQLRRSANFFRRIDPTITPLETFHLLTWVGCIFRFKRTPKYYRCTAAEMRTVVGVTDQNQPCTPEDFYTRKTCRAIITTFCVALLLTEKMGHIGKVRFNVPSALSDFIGAATMRGINEFDPAALAEGVRKLRKKAWVTGPESVFNDRMINDLADYAAKFLAANL